MTNSATNLMSLDRASMESMFDAMGEKRFRARQVLQWIYQRGVISIDAMTDLGKPLRSRLNRDAGIALPQVAARRVSADGTRKWLLQLADGNRIETVFIPEAARGTLCVSSQAGCALGCTFCATARSGFNRNLSVDEIIGQVWLANRELAESPASPESPHTARAVTNIVLMGMGEPLLNFDNVVPAMRLMTDDCSFGLSRRRVTLSTAGLAPAIERLGATCPVSLAVSLHAPEDELRTQLVPLNKKYPLARLLAACRRYAGARRQITFEYVLLDGVNASPAQARALARLLGDMPAKVNLIPFNPSPGIAYRRPPPSAVERFRDILLGAGIFTVTRKTRGDDIDAACGQLAGQVIARNPRARQLQFEAQTQ
ncbi:MAG: 23S rRNA (adenine(2503)-C(2))-methyltransferase RlmN [Gammaproteobacteria bacterium]